MACSIIRNQDARLIHLADELAEKYGKNWFSPKFFSDILTKNKAEVFEKHSPWLKSDEALYLFDILGLTYFSRRKYQESDQAYNSRKKHQMVALWGDYEYGQIDSRRMFECPFEGYDERWLVALTEAKQPKISLQIYFRGRGGVLYDAFDEMLGQNTPKEFENESVKKRLQTYFQQKEAQSNGQSTLYIDMLNFLDVPISEEMLRKHIDCKENAVSEYNIPPLLNNETQWTKEQKLAFYATLPPKLVNKDELKKLQSEK